MKYEVKPVNCDYGLFFNNNLKIIFNSKKNAEKVKVLLELDSKHKVYKRELDIDLCNKLTEINNLQDELLDIDIEEYKYISVKEKIETKGIENMAIYVNDITWYLDEDVILKEKIDKTLLEYINQKIYNIYLDRAEKENKLKELLYKGCGKNDKNTII